LQKREGVMKEWMRKNNKDKKPEERIREHRSKQKQREAQKRERNEWEKMGSMR
jgi:hypothetical protein